MRRSRLRMACWALLLAPLGAGAAESDAPDPFAFFADRDTRPIATIIATDFASSVDVGASYVSSDSFNFGRYNGLSQSGVYADLDMDLAGSSPSGWLGGLVTDWRLIGMDLGLDTRTLELGFGRPRDYRVQLGFDQLKQVLNDTGRTPYRGSDFQTLPDGWVASNLTTGMTELFDVSRKFDQELKRDTLSLSLDKYFGSWRIGASASTLQQDGRRLQAGALYADASNGHAANLARKVDFTTNQLQLDVGFAGDRLAADLIYDYSNFDNGDDALTWQDPFTDVFGPLADYPDGFGRLALEPDNEMQRIRAVGAYRITPRLRFRFDTSYSETKQNQNFLPFTVNEIPGVAALPRANLDGKVNVATVNGSINFQPKRFRRLTLEASYHLEERNNKGPRDGYLYVRGDVWAPDDDAFTVYNTTHDRTVNRGGLEGTYRLPWRSARLTLGYGFEQIERSNVAVSRTKEDSWKAEFRLQPAATVEGRIELELKDRRASTYRWDQSFYGLLDAALINEIPDNERYITHPLLSQYFLANREQTRLKGSLGYTPNERWQLRLDGTYTNNDYDESDLGLTGDQLGNLTATAAYTFSRDLTASVFVSYDAYKSRQMGRAFRGGIEKNAFATEPPLPQASDPARDWRTELQDTVYSVGANARWVALPDRLEMEWEYNFYDAEGQTEYATFGAPDLSGEPLPNNDSKQHNVRWVTTWHLRDTLSLDFEYQYYRFKADDWALDGVAENTIGRVLWTGQRSPSDVVQYFLIKAQYRFRQ